MRRRLTYLALGGTLAAILGSAAHAQQPTPPQTGISFHAGVDVTESAQSASPYVVDFEGRKILVEQVPMLTGSDLKCADLAASPQDEPAISFVFGPRARRVLEAFGRDHFGEVLVILVDGQVHSASTWYVAGPVNHGQLLPKGDPSAVLARIHQASKIGHCSRAKPQDVGRAKARYRSEILKGLKTGDSIAFMRFQAALADGTITPRNEQELVGWIRTAADAGIPEAMSLMGVVSATGLTGQIDGPSAVAWWTKAANRGETLAMFSLGRAYTDGALVPADTTLARRWLDAAAARGVNAISLRALAAEGNRQAADSMAWFYEHGEGGVERDPEAAQAWRDKAEQ